jgi:hypothetical protein
MTELQILIIEAIDLNGGLATFEEIYDHVSKSFDNLRRRDGTPYTSDCKRAIQASLSNNPITRPFFKKENKKGICSWALAKRSLEFLAEHKKLKRNDNLSYPQSEEKKNFLSLKEEPINESDLEGSLDDEDEIIESDKEEEKESKKDEKHSFPNRVKRARQFKERQVRKFNNNSLENLSKNERESRLKKKRK